MRYSVRSLNAKGDLNRGGEGMQRKPIHNRNESCRCKKKHCGRRHRISPLGHRTVEGTSLVHTAGMLHAGHIVTTSHKAFTKMKKLRGFLKPTLGLWKD